jgi:hypothetical protein
MNIIVFFTDNLAVHMMLDLLSDEFGAGAYLGRNRANEGVCNGLTIFFLSIRLHLGLVSLSDTERSSDE